jgi:hypothetical protein
LKHIDFSLLDKHKPALVISTGAVPLTAMALSRFRVLLHARSMRRSFDSNLNELQRH